MYTSELQCRWKVFLINELYVGDEDRNIKDITLMKNEESFVFLFYLILWRKANVECKFPQMERGNVRISGITTIFNLQLPPALCRQSRQSSPS